jgi:mevalonate kinase
MSKVKYQEKPYSFRIKSEIPSRKNLGSSAALSVAASAAFLHFYAGREFTKEVINQIAYQSEKHFHGNPSGGDNSASCFGGFIYYRKEFEFLKNISSLNAKIPKNIMDHLFILDSGKSAETTGDMVAKVGKLYNENPKHTGSIMNEIERVTKRMVVAIVKEDPKMFAEAVAENEKLLESLGVVSPKTVELLSSLKEIGTGKVTGGGGYKAGSGNLLFFAYDPQTAEQAIKKKNITAMKFTQDFEGVKNQS